MLKLPQVGQKVIVGLSGGVDSAVSAYLLKRAGFDVAGMFMKNWEEDDTENNCTSAVDLQDAKMVCAKLDIELHVVNFSLEYWENVFEDCLAAYRDGYTPNPDVLCNREIKFKAFLDYAKKLGADWIATGHYAKNILSENKQNWELHKADDLTKDQSYFLYTLGQAQLSNVIFPLGDYLKSDVRKIAAQIGFTNHAKKDSTGICFIGERNFKKFLQQYLPIEPGDIETIDGDKIGRHEGLMYYTIGQRQGLGIGGIHGKLEVPWYIVDKDLQRNVLIIAQGDNHPRLFRTELTAKNLSWIDGKDLIEPLDCHAKIRYRQIEQDCLVIPDRLNQGRELKVIFKNPQRAVTPGQSIVFYQNSRCLGGGVIL